MSKEQAVKLTKAQIVALGILSTGPQTAYGSGLKMGTLDSLLRRGLVAAINGPGAFYSPWTAIRWRITPAGLSALQAQGDQP